MHTIMVLAAGFALLGVCLLTGKMAGGSNAAMANGALVFLPLWLVAAAANLWYGVSNAGYSIPEELPIFLVIFSVPAVVALIVWWLQRAA
jgi:hypothetical protein